MRQLYCSYHSRGQPSPRDIIQILSDKWDENGLKTNTKHYKGNSHCPFLNIITKTFKAYVWFQRHNQSETQKDWLTKDSKEYPLLSEIFSFVPQIVIFSGRSSRVFIGSISKLTVELPSQLEFVLKQFSFWRVELGQYLYLQWSTLYIPGKRDR